MAGDARRRSAYVAPLLAFGLLLSGTLGGGDLAPAPTTATTPTQINLSVSPSPASEADGSWLEAAVTPNPGQNGTVAFLIRRSDGDSFDQYRLPSAYGTVRTRIQLGIGSYEITATYSGHGELGPSSSETIAHQVWPRRLATPGFALASSNVFAYQRVPFSGWAEPNPGGGNLLIKRHKDQHQDPYRLDPETGRIENALLEFSEGSHEHRAFLTDTPLHGLAIGCPLQVDVALRPGSPTVSVAPGTLYAGQIASITLDVFDPLELPNLYAFLEAELWLVHEDGVALIPSTVDVSSGKATVLRELPKPGKWEAYIKLPAHVWAVPESPRVAFDVLPAADGPYPALPTARPGAMPTTVTLGALPATAQKGDNIVFTATVDPPPTEGMVRIYDGAQEFAGLWQTSPGVFTSSVYPLPEGVHRFRAHYEGSAEHAASASGAHELSVSAIATQLALSLSKSNVDTATPVTVTATVSPAPALGIVHLYANGRHHTWGHPDPNTGAVSWTESWPVNEGSAHRLSAIFVDGGRQADAFSGPALLNVELLPTAVQLQAPPNVANAGTTFNARVTLDPLAPNGGRVRIYAGEKLVVESSVSQSPADISLALSPGVHSLRASYQILPTHAESWSAPVNVTVGPYADRKPIEGTLTVNGGNPYVNGEWVLLEPALAPGSYDPGQFLLSNDGVKWAVFSFDSRYTNAIMWRFTDPACGGKSGEGTHRIYFKWSTANNWNESPQESVEVTITQSQESGLVLDRVVPLVTEPTVSILSGSTQDQSVSARLNWSGSDARSGIAQFELQQSTDGGQWTDLALLNPAATQLDASLRSGSEYRFRVRARDRAGNLSGWQTSPAVNPSTGTDTSAPQAQAPLVSILAATRLGNEPKLRVAWHEATDDVAVVRYELQRRTNADSWKAVSLASPLARSANVALAPGGNSYTFRLRAFDAAGNSSSWKVGPNFTLSRLQEKSTSVSYSGGGWKRVALSGASGGYVRKARATGNRAVLNFTGRAVGFVTTLGPSRGKATIWLDGIQLAKLDLYAATAKKAWVAVASDLPPGPHTLRVEVTGAKRPASSGTRVDVDAFLVIR